MREDCTLRMSENGLLKRIFGSRRDEVTEKWRKLHNEELLMICTPYLIFFG
jgi:hypothetical protein